MSEQGFGSPNTNDAGYGSPFQTGTSDTGYGSPFNIPSNSLFVFGETRFAPEHGGEKIEVIGNFAGLLGLDANNPEPAFGIKAAFVNGSDIYQVYSGVPSFRYNFMTDIFKRKVTIFTPPLPQAIYDLRLTLPDNTEIVFDDVIEVINSSRYEEVYSMRQSLPQHWSVGALNLKGELPYFDVKQSNLEILTESIGEAINTTAGQTYTKLLDDFNYDDTECTVESTYNFKKSGIVWIGSVKCSYTSVSSNQLFGITRLNEFNKNVEEGSKVSQNNSKIKEALDDTLISKSSDESLQIHSSMFGLDKPNFILSEYFKDMIVNTVYNAKGTYGVLLAGIESIFDQWSDLQWTVNGTATTKSTIEFESHDSIPVWENRWMRIKPVDSTSPAALYYSVRREDNLFYFADVNTSMFSAANFDVATEYEVKVLPFIIEEWVDQSVSSTSPQNDITNARRMGKVRVYVDGDIFAIAGTYLRENGEERENEPFGMHLMNLSSTNEDERFTTENQGPYPLYFSQDELSNSQNAEFGRLFDELVCSGIDLSVLNRTWVSGLSSGLSGVFDITQSGTAGVGPVYIAPEI
jgi:hypothetical protein